MPRPTAATATRGSSTFIPGNTTGRDVIRPCNLRNVTTDPLNETEPTNTVNDDAASVTIESCCPDDANSTIATIAAAAPPTPLNNATSCGIAVIATRRAAGTPNAHPTAMPPRINPMWSRCSATRVTTTARIAPSAPIRFPRRAYFGDERPFNAKMKQTAATR